MTADARARDHQVRDRRPHTRSELEPTESRAAMKQRETQANYIAAVRSLDLQ